MCLVFKAYHHNGNSVTMIRVLVSLSGFVFVFFLSFFLKFFIKKKKEKRSMWENHMTIGSAKVIKPLFYSFGGGGMSKGGW